MHETKLIMITCTCFVKVCMGSVMQAFIHHSHDRGGHCTIRTIYNLLSLERWQPWHIHVPFDDHGGDYFLLSVSVRQHADCSPLPVWLYVIMHPKHTDLTHCVPCNNEMFCCASGSFFTCGRAMPFELLTMHLFEAWCLFLHLLQRH